MQTHLIVDVLVLNGALLLRERTTSLGDVTLVAEDAGHEAAHASAGDRVHFRELCESATLARARGWNNCGVTAKQRKLNKVS